MELWAREFHHLRLGLGFPQSNALTLATKEWLAACWCRREAIPLRCALERIGADMLEVAAVRFLDEGGEILVNEVDDGGHLIVDPGDLIRRHWVRPPVPIPVEIMKLALEHGGRDGQG